MFEGDHPRLVHRSITLHMEFYGSLQQSICDNNIKILATLTQEVATERCDRLYTGGKRTTRHSDCLP